MLQRNADVIAFMQAGFIGAWGEWHTSSNNLTAPASRNQIRDALLAALPASRFIQLRYPPYVMDGTPTLPPLSAVLTGGLRVGVHNDCFLASKTDVGTYDDDTATAAKQRDYVDRLGDLGPSAARPATRPTKPAPCRAANAPTSSPRAPATT